MARTAPYGHGGTFPTLLEVANHYSTRADDMKGDRTIGTVEEWGPLFDTNGQEQMPALLELLTAEIDTR